MNIAVIFAGGTGRRMNSRTTPKQFLELHGKPILIYTLEHFQKHKQIDGIVLVCLENWIGYCTDLINEYKITKVSAVVPGGKSGQESIYHGVKRASEIYTDESIVLIHDGVRPLIDSKVISEDIECTGRYGNAITVSMASETVVYHNGDGLIGNILDRSRCMMARAPQCFILKDVLAMEERARKENKEFIDTASLMQYYGSELHAVTGPVENIKITTPEDYFILRAILDARENQQLIY